MKTNCNKCMNKILCKKDSNYQILCIMLLEEGYLELEEIYKTNLKTTKRFEK